MPDGEIYTSPVEDSIEGWIRFSYPSLVYGWEADGIELHFERGRVVKATAEKGQDKLLEQLEVDEGAKYVGELGIGTNENVDRFTKNMLFDEKIGGTIHLALGNGFPEAGGANQSAIHWDLLCDMRDGGTIEIDGELFYESGEFIAK
jgi:aminopeptidase